MGETSSIFNLEEKKKAEEALVESEEKYRNLVENMSEVIYTLDCSGIITSVNNAVEDILGYKPNEIIGKNFIELISKDVLPEAMKRFKQSISGKRIRGQTKIIDKKVKPHYIEFTTTPIFKDNEVIGTQGIIRDITDRIKAEEALKESELKFRSMMEQSSIPIAIYNPDGHLVKGNEALAKLWGVNNQQLEEIYEKYNMLKDRQNEKLGVSSLVKKAFEGKFVDVYTIQYDASETLSNIGAKYTKANIRYIECRFFPIKTDEGKLLHVVLLLEDVTDKKKTEDLLKESEEKYRTLVEAVPNTIIAKLDNKGKLIYINLETTASITGRLGDGFDTFGERLEEVHPEDHNRIAAATLEATKGKTINHLEFRLRRQDGHYVDLLLNAVPLMNEKGEFQELLIVASDVSKLKKTENKLKESEEKYRLTIETAPCYITMIDKNFFIKEINYTVPGLDKKEVIGKKVFEFIEPRYHKKLEKTVEYVFKTGKSSQFESKARGSNNTIAWYDNRVGPIFKDGKVNEITIMGNDITERKRREKEIQKQFMKYDIEEGNCYLVLEKSNIKATSAFDDGLKTGFNGIIFSREKFKDLKDRIKNDFSYLWLSEQKHKNGIYPKNIVKYIDKIEKNSIILIDRFDYILQKLGFNKTLSLIQNLNEIAYMKNHIILISLDPDVIDKKQLKLIEKETIELEPKHKIKLDDDQIEILKYTHKQNLINNKPSYTDLSTYLKSSKPTMRNKIRILKENGYLIEQKHGNKKVLEISEKTRHFLT